MLIRACSVLGCAAAAVAAAALLACAGAKGEPRAHLGRDADADGPTLQLKRSLPGRLLVLAGPESRSDTLYAVGAGGRLAELPAAKAFAGELSGAAARGDRVALVHDALGADEVQLLSLTKPNAARSLGAGYDVDLGPHGSIAYTEPRYRDGRSWEVVRVRRAGRSRRIRVRGQLFNPRWRPDGRLVVVSERGRRTRLIIGAGGRHQRQVPAVPNTPSQLLISSRGVMAYGYVGNFSLLTPRGRVIRRFRIPWRPLAWAPDGRSLLLTDQRSRLALLRLSRDRIEHIGRLTGASLHAAAWR